MDPFSITLRDGGGTFDVVDGVITHANPDYGYTVAVVDGTAVSIRMKPDGTALPVDLVVKNILWVAAHYNTKHVGTWLDGLVIHIDPVRTYQSEYLTRAMAKNYNQQSYYDNFKKEVILV